MFYSDGREYALKQIEGTGISMSACREIAVSLYDMILFSKASLFINIYMYLLLLNSKKSSFDTFLYISCIQTLYCRTDIVVH